ncbi:MAG: nicotinate-nucleotide adenylyltransferase [Cellulosilyticaceae bacterium]
MTEVSNRCRRIAIMGGTFDPIHMGHLVTAEAVRHEFNIDEVIFVPTGIQPHKLNMSVTSTEHRYLMTVLATTENEFFRVSRMEIDRTGITYTIDTIKELHLLYGEETKLYFITGADAVHEILTWKNSEELFKICTFIAVTRPGYDKNKLIVKIEELRNSYASNIYFLEVPALSISSSDIRKRVKDNSTIKYLVTPAVENYINKYSLYKYPVTFENESIRKMTEYVKKQLSKARYEHTRGVIDRAIELGNIYNIDIDKLFISALFHDVAKEFSKEQIIELCKKYNLTMDEFEMKHIEVNHGKLGAAILENEWKIKDEELLNSIRSHTVGRHGMSDIEKIIFLADMTEYGRKTFPALEKIRRLSEIDLNCAMYEALVTSKEYVGDILKQDVHPITNELIEVYRVYDI